MTVSNQNLPTAQVSLFPGVTQLRRPRWDSPFLGAKALTRFLPERLKRHLAAVAFLNKEAAVKDARRRHDWATLAKLVDG